MQIYNEERRQREGHFLTDFLHHLRIFFCLRICIFFQDFTSYVAILKSTIQTKRNLIAKMKLLTVEDLIKDKRLVLIDDSIVRGTQLRETAEYFSWAQFFVICISQILVSKTLETKAETLLFLTYSNRCSAVFITSCINARSHSR